MRVPKTVAGSFDRAAARFLLERETEMDVTQRTLTWYRQKLSQLGRETEVAALADLTRDDLLAFIAALRKAGRSPHYVRGWYQVFRTFIGWARDEGIAVHPSLLRDGEKWFALKKPIETEAEIEIFSPEDLDRIYEVAGRPRNVVLCQLLVGTGLRITEALTLTLDDIQDDRLRVRQGKGRKPRWVPISRQLQLALARWVDRSRGDVKTDRVFPNRSGEPWSLSSAEELMRRIRLQTKLPVKAHAFRHTFATEYLKRGGEIDRLRRILGHTTFAMVAKYARLAGVGIGRDIDKLSPY